VNRSQLMQLLKSLSIKSLYDRGSDIYGCCPFHDDAHPSWGISVVKPGHPSGCFTCKNGLTSVVYLVAKIKKISVEEAHKYCCQYGDVLIPDVAPQFFDIEKSIIDSDKKAHLNLPVVTDYRQISQNLLMDSQIRYDGFNNQVQVPYRVRKFDRRKRKSFISLEGFVSISVGDGKKKKLYSPPWFNHRDHFWSIPEYLSSKCGFLILVEGHTDALKMYDVGYRNVMAVGSCSMSKTQRESLHNPGEIIIMFDNDSSGKRGSIQTATSMPVIGGCPVSIAFLKKSKDPFDATKEEIEEAIRNRSIVV